MNIDVLEFVLDNVFWLILVLFFARPVLRIMRELVASGVSGQNGGNRGRASRKPQAASAPWGNRPPAEERHASRPKSVTKKPISQSNKSAKPSARTATSSEVADEMVPEFQPDEIIKRYFGAARTRNL